MLATPRLIRVGQIGRVASIPAIRHRPSFRSLRYAVPSAVPAVLHYHGGQSDRAVAAAAAAAAAGAAAMALLGSSEQTKCEAAPTDGSSDRPTLAARGIRQTNYGVTRPGPGRANKVVPEAILLLSDVDGTLTGSADGLDRFNRHWNTVQAPRGSVLVYNTARPKGPGPTATGFTALVQSKKGNMELMLPDVLMVGEGTEIYWVFNPTEGDEMMLDPEWDALLAADWDEEEVVAAMGPHDHDIWLSGVEISCEDKYRYAISVATEADAERAVAAVTAELDQSRYKVLSFPMHWAEGWLVTVLPRKAGKCAAAEYISKKLGFVNDGMHSQCCDRVVWAGDSENDIGMLSTSIRGIIVGNVTAGLKDAADAGSVCKLMFAESRYADGVLEGLAQYGLAEDI